MTEWLSDEWAKAVAEAASVRPALGAGRSGTVSITISGGPSGEVSHHWSYKDGAPAGGSVGAATEPDVAFRITAADALSIASGDVEPSVAFMRGRLKADGEGGLLLAWLESTSGPQYEEWRRHTSESMGIKSGAAF